VAPFGDDGMRKNEKVPVVLVAAQHDVLNKVRDALTDTNFALLHASTKQEAIAHLEHLRYEIDVAVVELELPDFGSWELIRRITFLPDQPVRIIATTSMYPESFFGKIKDIGIDVVLPKAIPLEQWRTTVEEVLMKNKRTSR
jgi:DNA-binding response OmpR family regulator